MRTLLCLVLVVALAGFVHAQEQTPEATPPPDATAEITPEATLSPDATAEATAESTPEPGFPSTGSFTVRQQFGGVERSYRITIPARYETDAGNTSLIIVMHGAGGNGAGIESFSGFNELAEEQGFIVIYPNGLNNAWADGRVGDPRIGSQDDVAYISRVIDYLTTNLRIDPKRIYATGHSMGGFMAYRLGCQLPDRIAAIAPVSATFPIYLRTVCEDAPPVPVALFHGTDDQVVPWNGIPGGYLSASDTLNFWAGHNQCQTDDGITPVEDAAPTDRTFVLIESASDCLEDADVKLYGVYHGGHTWPGHAIQAPFELGLTTLDVDASAEIVQFFDAHPA